MTKVLKFEKQFQVVEFITALEVLPQKMSIVKSGAQFLIFIERCSPQVLEVYKDQQTCYN